ncbi:MAG TPA: mandelate racemase/muconate lactonizing enzyme family protein, partial [Acidimicrobiales bacterium]|nr:mandelate racemase/muconate lactonizing enzyme family protein [Acidimicrobiales bacterium]
MSKNAPFISEIRIYKTPLPAKTLYNMSSSAVMTPESTIVQLIDCDGVIGYGEACMATAQAQDANNDSIRSSLSLLAPPLIGMNPMQLDLINSTMENLVTGETEAKAAIDIACWDLIGKRLEKSVAELLGGNGSGEVITY